MAVSHDFRLRNCKLLLKALCDACYSKFHNTTLDIHLGG